MDPAFVDNEIWHGISGMLRFLWVYVFFVSGAAFNFLIAHAIIPSLAGSGQIPERAAKLRKFFYLSAGGIMVIAVAALVISMAQVGVVGDVFNRWWI